MRSAFVPAVRGVRVRARAGARIRARARARVSGAAAPGLSRYDLASSVLWLSSTRSGWPVPIEAQCGHATPLGSTSSGVGGISPPAAASRGLALDCFVCRKSTRQYAQMYLVRIRVWGRSGSVSGSGSTRVYDGGGPGPADYESRPKEVRGARAVAKPGRRSTCCVYCLQQGISRIVR